MLTPVREAPLRDDPPQPAVAGALRRGRVAGLFLLAGLLVLIVMASFAIGAERVPLSRVLPGIFEPDGSQSALIIQEMRLPRTLLGLAVGASLGLAGALMQALTRNPLAEPGVLGVNGGAALAVVLLIWLADVDQVLVYVWAAFAGAAGAVLLVYMIGSYGRAGATPGRLVLAGAALNAVFSALTNGVMLLDPHGFNSFRFWQVGSLAGRDLATLAQVGPFMAAGVLLALSLARSLNVLALGEEAGRALGGSLGRTRALGALAVVLLSGAATAAVGPIAFLGLAVPFIVRALVGPDQRWVLPYSLLLAPVLLLGADIVGRVVAPPAELETGIVTAFLGAPIFIMLVRRGRMPKL
ncbi:MULTISPECIES: FecCD family ABC transporter permease [Thermomonospora]|uniref:Transport system permease protein n=1 Tax=Thermomonospora curvata (strain ATCC 19995 / DSM 43183 / JCM 3096 / KCTC 9072 / NBRC 15933 / NCIMB 10081 / Henssen B9) TaxID=471852 RepID=D1A2D8_THECD|nr:MULTISPECIES: iron chelate uptake ABC transporter family permease subunit [Thermomonospora]ACY95958.1 transport system permease protein [Thermomonospora curvata DSM 43183]PKK16199.1 MAG: Fe(3+)-siderophore ABC transporter permease [Thermomonospora sp. CIF 1]